MSRPSISPGLMASIITKASQAGDIDVFKILLDEYYQYSATLIGKMTHLHVAAVSGNLDFVTSIVSPDDPVPGEVMNAKDDFGYTPLHLAVYKQDDEIVQRLLSTPETDTFAVASNMQGSVEIRGRNDFAPLHFAALQGSLSIVNMLLDHAKCRADKYQPHDLILMKSKSRKTPLHYAAEGGHWQVVSHLLGAVKNTDVHRQVVNCVDIWRQTPLHLATFNRSFETVEILLREGEGLNVNATTWEGITALDMAKKDANQKIVQMLENFDVSWLEGDRQKYASAANAILVGAALIAGVTYASWLQPPLGLVPYYDSPVPGAPPDTYESFVAVKQHWELQVFWVFNSFSFFFSTATLVIGAAAGIPRKCTYLREEVAELRSSVVVASYLLSAGIAFIIAAFCIAGTLVLPPIQKYRITMYVCVPLGALFCSILLFQYVWKVWRWSSSPNLRYTRHPTPESKYVWKVWRWSLSSTLRYTRPTPESRAEKPEDLVSVAKECGVNIAEKSKKFEVNVAEKSKKCHVSVAKKCEANAAEKFEKWQVSIAEKSQESETGEEGASVFQSKAMPGVHALGGLNPSSSRFYRQHTKRTELLRVCGPTEVQSDKSSQR